MKYLILILSFAALTNINAQHVINLAGEWQFQTDKEDVGVSQNWHSKTLHDKIDLPASMPQRLKGDDITTETKWVGSLYDSSYFYNPYLKKYRQPDNMKLTFFLTPDKHYVGVAWYNKKVNLQKIDKEKNKYMIFLERPHIQTTLYINGCEVGTDRSLCVPHQYDVTEFLQKGENTISIRVDNRPETVNVGQDSHSVTDQTQGDWNGIVGAMELRTIPKLYLERLKVFPDIDNKRARVVATIVGKTKGKVSLLLYAKAFNNDFDSKKLFFAIEDNINICSDTTIVDTELFIGDDMMLWDEFNPNLYSLKAAVVESKERLARQIEKIVKNKKKNYDECTHAINNIATAKTVFGMRTFDIKDKMFYVNGRQIQLRGTVDNCDFPITGYPPMNTEEWIDVFRTCKKYGINHVRFHSYCPPEAAFCAADLTGVYLQPEGPSWPNHGVKLGYGDDIDAFLMEETQRLTQEYGNHPSFCMLACGNEPAGRWVEWVGKFVDYWKKNDNRRVYTGASVGGGWAWQPKSQYHVKAGARGLAEWNRKAPATSDDFSRQISHYAAKDLETDINEPYVSHETGQWCAFPNFDEIKKYTGVNKAKNFEVFLDILNEHGMGEMAHKFFMASGKLQAICYKYEIEKTLRTKDYAGFQLLGLNDYSGQGTALVGVTDVFYDQKEYISPEEFREFCAPIVLLAKIPKFTYRNNETIKAEILINQFSDTNVNDEDIIVTLKDRNTGHVYDSKTFQNLYYTVGSAQRVGEIEFNLSKVVNPAKLTIEAQMIDSEVKNHWDVWVYPANVELTDDGIYTTDSLDHYAIEILNNGGNVLLTAPKVRFGNEVVQYFTPVFWNTSWFKMRPPHTTGIFVQTEHPALSQFVTDYHSDLQWWELVNKTPVMQFDEFPGEFQPIVQSIDTWFLSRKIGLLFEANVLNGKLVMTTMDIKNNLEQRIVARQMRKSITDYMRSDNFKPKFNIDIETISNLFTKDAPKIDMFTKDSPDELKPSLVGSN